MKLKYLSGGREMRMARVTVPETLQSSPSLHYTPQQARKKKPARCDLIKLESKFKVAFEHPRTWGAHNEPVSPLNSWTKQGSNDDIFVLFETSLTALYPFSEP
jgi:hypothetical protein